MKIAISQMKIEPGNIENNFLKMKEIIIRSSRLYNSELIVFPELAIQGAQKEILVPEEKYIEEFKKLAKDYNIWIIPGSMYIKEREKVYNRLFVINRKGEITGHYDKIFPWEPFEPIEHGKDILVFDFEDKLIIGVGICYDLFFPEIARAMVLKGAELLIYPHYTTTSDRKAELNIARAYAIINSAYVISFNGVNNYLVGKSAIYGPEGEELQRTENDEIILTEIISRERVKEVRENGIKGVTTNYKHFIEYKENLKNIVNQTY